MTYKHIIKKIFRRYGIKVERLNKIESEILTDAEFMKIYEQCKDYTLNTVPALYQLYKSVIYIIKNNIDGDFVECGVLRGGNIRLIALTLMNLNVNDRKIWCYDTYEGMVGFSDEDKIVGGEKPFMMCDSDLDLMTCGIEEVKENVYSTNYPKDNFIFVKGDVCETLKTNIPTKISLFRLDTDYYESTKSGLKYLYPLLNTNGVVIFDDYGTFAGSKKAVDDYFKDNPILLVHVDNTTRLILKTKSWDNG